MIFKNRRFELVLNLDDLEANVIQLGGYDYYLGELYPGARTGKGGNSCVFLATASDEETKPLVVKVCKFPVDPPNSNFEKRIRRFRHEIKALAKAKASAWSQHVVPLEGAGVITVPGDRGRDVKLLYYTMEQADADLARYLEDTELNLEKRLELVVKLAQALHGLHQVGIVHRDLKPDNIFFYGDQLRIGDLGLVDDREGYSIDDEREKIGPMGYLTPEAVNKAFCDRSRLVDLETVALCERSDVFQLALVAFYILQGEIPVGCLQIGDLLAASETPAFMSELLMPMLQFRKARRPDLATALATVSALIQSRSVPVL